MQKVEKVAKVELDEATGALQTQLVAAVDANKHSHEAIEALESRAVGWDGLCGRLDAFAADAATARESLKNAFAQVLTDLCHLQHFCACQL
jgi:hypothetical protein